MFIGKVGDDRGAVLGISKPHVVSRKVMLTRVYSFQDRLDAVRIWLKWCIDSMRTPTNARHPHDFPSLLRPDLEVFTL